MGTGGSGGSSAAGGTGGGAGAAPVACRGLAFDGVKSFVHVPDDAELDGLSALTVEAFVRADSYPAEVQLLSHHDHDLATGYVLLIFEGSEMQLRYQFAGSTNAVGFTAVSAGQWHHVSASYDAGEVLLFVDGKLREQQTTAVGVADDCKSPLTIGRAAYSDSFHFQGVIDEVRLSRVARYKQDFMPAKSLFVPDQDTVALWHFDDPDGQTVKDATGKHDGTLGATSEPADDDPTRVDVPCLVDLPLGG